MSESDDRGRGVEKPFVGTPPTVEAGDRVLARNVTGRWIEMVALSGPRYDHQKRLGRSVWLSVPLVSPDAWERRGAKADYVNWPAEAVRLAPTEGEGA